MGLETSVLSFDLVHPIGLAPRVNECNSFRDPSGSSALVRLRLTMAGMPFYLSGKA
jgi:hypothetical protein